MRIAHTTLALLTLCGVFLFSQNPGWHYDKVDPHTKKQILRIDAKSFEATKDSAVILLRGMSARIYANNRSTYRQVTSDKALLNRTFGTLTYGPNFSKVVNLK
jgi:hypothetical protein